ncbi:pentapeptide repeat-containing protein [Clostridium cellulovorans]|uniref:Pentapeptide repeat protein n=1 Tax=Clostridium cellulovorans (strain ATCC 35296 / DSM 3052 / OCM 3 / 743B) TaxID=573061 RepID=D9SNF3_CLOC7|nr:pentapeptide repeat-containing protein [Clostridium cellulovorans]ADL53945.1 pentapeptide repeat protein [Clostridium cellulovorans 743B]
MSKENRGKLEIELYKDLRIDCKKCFGFCCIALYFSASDGFPTDKEAGEPCINLCKDFSCAIHKDLRNKGLKGCTAYDCFGAGQRVAQGTYRGENWQQNKELSKQMFQVFLVMRQLHEMLWYLTNAYIKQTDNNIKDKINYMINETERLTHLDPNSLLVTDIDLHRNQVNSLLHQTSEFLRTKVLKGQKTSLKRKKTIAGRLDLIGTDLRKTNLRGADLRGAFLIAANLSDVDLSYADLIGADLRDADIRGTNLENSLFITQAQVNTAKGDSKTRLPKSLTRPQYWSK